MKWLHLLLEEGQWADQPDRKEGVFASLEHTIVAYNDIEGTYAWKDYQKRLVQLREATSQDIIVGTLDSQGKDRTNEKRAALFILDTLLSYLPRLKRQYEQMCLENEKLLARGKKAKNLHGSDSIMTPLDR